MKNQNKQLKATDFIQIQELGSRNDECLIPTRAFLWVCMFSMYLCGFCSFLLQSKHEAEWVTGENSSLFLIWPWDKLQTCPVCCTPNTPCEGEALIKKKKKRQIHPSATRHLAKGQRRGRHQITSFHYRRLYHSADRINVQRSRDTKQGDISREWKFTGGIHERSSGVFRSSS